MSSNCETPCSTRFYLSSFTEKLWFSRISNCRLMVKHYLTKSMPVMRNRATFSQWFLSWSVVSVSEVKGHKVRECSQDVATWLERSLRPVGSRHSMGVSRMFNSYKNIIRTYIVRPVRSGLLHAWKGFFFTEIYGRNLNLTKYFIENTYSLWCQSK